VVIDLQKGIAGMAGVPHSSMDVVANSARLLAAARRVGARPVLVHVGGSPDGADRLHQTVDQPMRMSAPPPPD
jgi:nicotinamidase-related amidase